MAMLNDCQKKKLQNIKSLNRHQLHAIERILTLLLVLKYRIKNIEYYEEKMEISREHYGIMIFYDACSYCKIHSIVKLNLVLLKKRVQP